MIYLVDIDGTVADLSHRLHFIEGETQDWDAFYDACDKDTPIQSVIDVINALDEAGHIVLFVSGRNEVVRGKTNTWLEDHMGFYPGHIYMRSENDRREDTVVKSDLYDKITREWFGERNKVVGVFDDRASVVKMWREKGLKVFHVAEGNF